MIKILLKFKDKVLKSIETDKSEITIGRSKNNDIQIDNLAVSKQHAKLIKQQNQYTLEDLKSTNGTFLNDEKITKANLDHNDIVTIGKHTLTIYYTKAAKASVQDFAEKTIKLTFKAR